MKLNKKIFGDAADEVNMTVGGRKITIYSEQALKVLKYFELTIPRFSKGVVAAKVLEEVLRKKYKKEWKLAEKYVDTRSTIKSSQTIPELTTIDESAFNRAKEETKTRDGRLISVYSPKVSTVIRYLSKSIPKYAISKESAILLEEGLKERYPEFWA